MINRMYGPYIRVCTHTHIIIQWLNFKFLSLKITHSPTKKFSSALFTFILLSGRPWWKIFRYRWTPSKFLRIISQLLEASFLGKVSFSAFPPSLFHKGFSLLRPGEYTSRAFLAQKERTGRDAGPWTQDPWLGSPAKVSLGSTVVSAPNHGDFWLPRTWSRLKKVWLEHKRISDLFRTQF